MKNATRGGVVVGGFGGLQGLTPAMREQVIARHRAACESKGLELVQVGPDDWVFMLPEREKAREAA